MKRGTGAVALSVVAVLALWTAAAWYIADANYQSRARGLVREETEDAHEHAQDLADSIKRNLGYLGGISELFTRQLAIDQAVAGFGASAAPSRLPYETRKKRWLEDPRLRALSRALSDGAAAFKVDMVFVLNAAGDCIASSDTEETETPVGSNFADRAYFNLNKDGKPGMQYAVGRTTHIPGLYFAMPIMANGRFMGAVVTKTEISKLTFLIRQLDSYVVDRNGVIILSHDKSEEMHAIAGAPVYQMPVTERINVYRQSEFKELRLAPWGDEKFPSLQTIHAKNIPVYIAAKEIPEYGLTVHVEGNISELPLLKKDQFWFFTLIWLLGDALILAFAAAGFYIRSVKQTDSALRESEEALFSTINTALDAVVQIDAKETITVWNDQAEKIFGWRREDVIGRRLHELIVPKAYREAHLRGMEKFLGGNYGPVLNRRIEIYALHREGHEFPIELSITPFKVGGEYRFSAFIRDITKRRQIEESMRLASQIYHASSEAVMVTDENNNILDVNPSFTQQTGYTLQEVLGKNPRLLQSGKHDKEFFQKMWKTLLEEGRWQGELWDKRKDGSLHVKLANLSVLRKPDGSIYRHVAQFFDVTHRKEQEELIWQQAYYDMLTNLPNRRLFQDRLELETKKSHRTGKSLALFVLDLDRFKEINDTLGHAKGDVLLAEAARRIQDCVRETDTVARLGGDEFTIILPEFGERLHLERIAQEIIQSLAKRFDLGDGDSGFISASIGIALYPDDAGDMNELVKHADLSMYAAKAKGRNSFNYFIASMQHEAQEKLALTNDLRGAISRNELEVYYQPIVNREGQVAKAEALLRWRHPVRGLVSPATFIPLAEESGLIVEIGDWVFRQAIESIEQWRKEFGQIIQISVNKSPLQFEQSGRAWMERLRESRLPPSSITVEITEGLLLKDSVRVKQRLLEFRNSGIEVSIDDFGTGFSALSYLKQFDIDYIKIDRSFVTSITENESDKALAEAIIVMAHKLGIKTIAEGVETQQQLYLLLNFGCDYFQGFLYSMPVPRDEFRHFLGG